METIKLKTAEITYVQCAKEHWKQFDSFKELLQYKEVVIKYMNSHYYDRSFL